MSSTSDEATDEIREALRLSLVQGVGPRIRQALLEQFGSSTEIFAAPKTALLSVAGVGNKLADRIVDSKVTIDVEHELNVCREGNVSIIPDSDATYPRMLKEIHDPPGILFVRGSFQPEDAMAVAIVGTRHATRYGLEQATRIAGGLARAGITVVSGMARGIDGAAHRGALEAGGRTIAVLGSGVLNVYPPEHKDLANDIQRRGAVVSELPPLMPPMSGSFPQRNRLVTGMSLGVVVIEAAQRSGALISTTHANEQGREVFAMPGRVDNRVARGCHQLIRDGARLIESVDDILEELGPLVEAAPREDGQEIKHPAELQLNEQELSVLNAIDTEATNIDAIVSASDLPVHRVLSTISVLEMRRLVRRISGQQVARI